MSVLAQTMMTTITIFLVLYGRAVDRNLHKEWQSCTLKTVLGCMCVMLVLIVKAII